MWKFQIKILSLHQKTIGLQNTASDCSSGGKGSEVLFLLYIWDIIRYTTYKF